jgi:phosphosulfolactate synthase (CoM biosynthesis protein A)
MEGKKKEFYNMFRVSVFSESGLIMTRKYYFESNADRFAEEQKKLGFIVVKVEIDENGKILQEY